MDNAKSMEGRRILVVDDNPASRELLRAALEPQYVVEEAPDGRTALSCLTQSLPDLILMDVQMPVMDGYEALREIRGNPDSAALPVIAITAFAMFEDRHKALKAGFDGYLPKPINVGALRKQIEMLLLKLPE
jgi:two-component system cell cycle response regulator DivK